MCYLLNISALIGYYCYDAKLDQLTLDITVPQKCVIVETWHVKPEMIDFAASKLAARIYQCVNQSHTGINIK